MPPHELVVAQGSIRRALGIAPPANTGQPFSLTAKALAAAGMVTMASHVQWVHAQSVQIHDAPSTTNLRFWIGLTNNIFLLLSHLDGIRLAIKTPQQLKKCTQTDVLS